MNIESSGTGSLDDTNVMATAPGFDFDEGKRLSIDLANIDEPLSVVPRDVEPLRNCCVPPNRDAIDAIIDFDLECPGNH